MARLSKSLLDFPGNWQSYEYAKTLMSMSVEFQIMNLAAKDRHRLEKRAVAEFKTFPGPGKPVTLGRLTPTGIRLRDHLLKHEARVHDRSRREAGLCP